MRNAEFEDTSNVVEGLPIWPGADIENRERKLKIEYCFQSSIVNHQLSIDKGG